MTINKIDPEIIHKIETQVTTIDIDIIPNHLIGIIIVIPIPNRHRSNTPKHERQINQVQTNEKITSDPPGIDNTENIEIQVNHKNCESTDSESDTDNNILVKMISVENDYESITYDEPFSSHIYEN